MHAREAASGHNSLGGAWQDCKGFLPWGRALSEIFERDNMISLWWDSGRMQESSVRLAKHSLQQFASFAEFRKQLAKPEKSGGVRVDHVGGLPEQTDVFRLRLHGAGKSHAQGSPQKRNYKTSGERVLLEGRLRKVPKRPSRSSKWW